MVVKWLILTFNRSNRLYFPVFPSQILIDLSNEALAIILVSGENLTSFMSCWWPVIRATLFLSISGFHKNIVKSSEPETNRSGSVSWKSNRKSINSSKLNDFLCEINLRKICCIASKQFLWVQILKSRLKRLQINVLFSIKLVLSVWNLYKSFVI